MSGTTMEAGRLALAAARGRRELSLFGAVYGIYSPPTYR